MADDLSSEGKSVADSVAKPVLEVTKGDLEASAGEDATIPRNGTWVTCVFHIITAVIGAGVLSLPYSLGNLGWVAGLLVMLIFAAITWYTSRLLASVCIIDGVRQRTYMSAVETLMGPMHCKILGIVQYFNLFLTAIAYNITGGVSMQDFAETYCGEEGGCFSTYWIFCVIFAVVQLVLSQLPNMDSLWWMSGIGTLMAFFYSIITLALSISVGNTHGTWDGIPNTPEKRMWSAFNAIGAIVFAFSFSFILVEIADTIRSDKRGIVYHAKKATDISMIIISGFYIAVSVAGYMAFGNSVCNNVISCFDHPAWVIRMTALFVLIHMLSAYQVFSQPVFYLTETTVGKKFNKYGAWAFRFTFRCAYVAFVAFVSICLPFFSDIVGLIGAIGFWPATIYYPVEMYILNNNPSRKKVIALQILNAFCCIVTILAVAGSIQLIIASSATYKLF